MVTLGGIEAARERIGDAVFASPCPRSETLSRALGCEVYLKLENLQMTGSFKERGSLNRILQLDAGQRAAGVIAASAGNHAQGVAHAALVSNIRATIVMPTTAPLAKVRGTSELGAEIVLHGAGYDEAFAYAEEVAEATGMTLVHAFDDTEVIAGQGTIGLEIAEQVPSADAVVVPVGGGGLIAGIAVALRGRLPRARIFGVQAEQVPSMCRALEAGGPVAMAPHRSLADGIAVARVGRHTFPIVQALVERLVAVDEESIAWAIMTLLEREKTLVEGAGAVGFAALQAGRLPELAGMAVVVVISGGNIDLNLLDRIIARGLETDGRLVSLRLVIPDTPGHIARVAGLVAEAGANILDITHRRSLAAGPLGETEVELRLETRGHQHVGMLMQLLRDSGLAVRRA